MSGFEPFLFGAAASGGAAATTGLLGAGGAFSAGTALATAGTVLSGLSAISQGRAAGKAADYNANLALAEASSKEAAQREAARRQIGSIRANIGKSGATSAGTPLMVLAESAANAEIDALNTRYGGATQSSIYRAGGADARRAGTIRAGTSLLTGFGQIR